MGRALRWAARYEVVTTPNITTSSLYPLRPTANVGARLESARTFFTMFGSGSRRRRVQTASEELDTAKDRTLFTAVTI